MVLLYGVKKSPSNAFYYDDNVVNMIEIPIAQCEGDYPLTEDELKHYFGVESSRMGKLPEYFIIPRLNSSITGDIKKSVSNVIDLGSLKERFFLGAAAGEVPPGLSLADFVGQCATEYEQHTGKPAPQNWYITGNKYWYITGEVVVYKPLAWVPIVRERVTIPKSHFETEYEKKKTTIQTSELYGKGEACFTMSIGGGWRGLKLELSSTVSVEADYRKSTEVKEEITQKGKIGDVVIKEVVMGMCLRMERVYENSVHLYLNDKGRDNSLIWRDCESSSQADPSELIYVGPLQFHPISMTGTGHSSSLYLQTLPVFSAEKNLLYLHLLLSCKGWTSWYTYNGGTVRYNSGWVETLPLPDDKPPSVTFIAHRCAD